MIEIWIVERRDDEKINPALFSVLTKEQYDYISSKQLMQDRYNSLLGTVLSRYVLENRFSCFYPIKRNADRKPYVDHFPGEINISHSNNTVVCAVNATGKIGVDIEEISEIDFAIITEFFSFNEQYMFHILSSKRKKQLLLYQLWTLKESFVKATGTGLGPILLSNIEFDLTGQPRLKFQQNNWKFHSGLLNETHCLSVCYSASKEEMISIHKISLNELAMYFLKDQTSYIG
ncbi:4'-phosphopantetheinyl transferase family protein [Metabacillus fastidiosus]|uniref:4'-phosphopantetheinyl transferase family protein n=1 Tax=Metabacillus fastidiosus TaxID=1458 RepID=UPI002E2113BE|nr:4'-phosphopantetheinyl transferase superfamily protein [Metabacillus fastidiosus]MED4455505.1 4'-phosphopantetheinyl transferase superfamily protein [Metabacillus fastidiosus]